MSKRYGSVQALDRVSLSFAPGEVHAVLGENGAGKSTLVSVMAGFVVPDTGSVEVDGVPIPLGRPFDCKRLGIEMIHQHFTLVPTFSVRENLALAAMKPPVLRYDEGQLAAPALERARQLGWDVSPEARVEDMPVGAQQRVEILKALAADAPILLFDEPTAVLSPAEIEDLVRVIRALRDEGRIVILIAHKLSEVFKAADRISVLRRGKLVATAALAETNPTQVAEWMVGDLPIPAARVEESARGEGLSVQDLRVEGDRGEEAVRGVDLEVGRGEIVGIGGVDGNGQVELAEALAQVRHSLAGTLEWQGAPLGDLRIGYIPQDRQADGLALEMSVEENMLIAGQRKAELLTGPFLRKAAIRSWAEALIARFAIKVDRASDPVRGLSGGNQQKVVVSRTLEALPDLLIAVNPTRGLDLKAASFVHDQIRSAREGGAAVALFSTDLDELAELADRTLFMSRGELAEGGDAVAVVGGAA